jgi:hypothetical protein
MTTVELHENKCIGVNVFVDGQQVGHWPMSMDEAAEKAAEEWPGAKIERYEEEG